MKTQIITLESHDDLISVRDRMSWAKTPRILLVWPKYEDVSLRLLELKVLQRQAESLGAQLGLVTLRQNVRRDAESLGIPVFESASAAQKELWPRPQERRRHLSGKPRQNLRAWRDSIRQGDKSLRTPLAGRVGIFAVGVLAVLAVAGLFVPRAAVTLQPESQIQTVMIPVTASKSFSSLSLTGSLPVQSQTVLLNQEQSTAVSTQISVPNSKAAGLARFTNLSQSEVKIPAGSVVFASGETTARFITLQETLLPAGLDQFVEVPIEAVAAGIQGNVADGQITAVEGQLGLLLSVTNLEPTTGGSETKQLGPTDADRTRLRDSLMEDLQREAETRLRGMLEKYDLLLMDTLKISQVIEESYSPGEGQPGRQLTMKMEVEFSVDYVSGDDLKRLALASLDASLPEGYMTFTEPDFETLQPPSTDEEGLTRFDLKAERTLLRRVETTKVFVLTRGLGPVSARDELTASFPLREPPEISLSPSWWPWMPLIPFNVVVEVK